MVLLLENTIIAILLKGTHIDEIGNGMQQRDYAILYGASDSLTLIYRKREFVFSGDKVACFPGEQEINNDLIQSLEPEEEDIVIITSSDEKVRCRDFCPQYSIVDNRNT